MPSFIDLEDEDLINADENELYVEEDNLEANNEAEENNLDADNAADPNAPANTTTRAVPKKKAVRKPQPKLDPERLKGPRGLIIMEKWFADIKFKGKGHEKEDLDAVMERLEQWTHRLFPKYTFDDTLKRIEALGHKSQVMNYVRRIRLGMVEEYDSHRMNNDIIDEKEPEIDPFDSLLIDKPQGTSTQFNRVEPPLQNTTLTEEQRERMIRNRLLAEERRLARAKARREELAQQQMEVEEPLAAE